MNDDDFRGARVRTISELARLAGVSTGTVSRALADKPMINRETRERIQALAREHGFRPNQMARNLRTQRTGVIGVVAPLGAGQRHYVSPPFYIELLTPLWDVLSSHGYNLMLFRGASEDRDWLERITGSGMLDGVVLFGQSDQVEAIERAAQRYRPLVVWGSHREGQIHCAVGTDNRAGGRLAAERLISVGKRRLAFVGDAGTPEMAERLAGANEAARVAGLDDLKVIPAAHDPAVMTDDVDRGLTHVEDIDGIVAGSDTIGVRVLRVLADRSVPVPDRIAVVGYDDLPFAELSIPRLTTIRQDLRHGAAALTDALVRRMGGEDAPSLVMPPELVIRESA